MSSLFESPILLTGFEPFGKYVTNISGELAKEMNGTEVMGCYIEGKVILVRFHEIRPLIEQYLENYRPCIAISTGIIPSFFIKLETVARNWVDSRPLSYNCGTKMKGRVLDRSAPPRLPSTLPIDTIFKRLETKDFPVSISNHAGKFACNQIFFHLMAYLKKNQRSIPAGFIHVPSIGMPLDDLIMVFREILEEIITRLLRART